MGKRRNVPNGTRFGRVVIIEEIEPKNKNRQFLCICDCGNECNKSIKTLFKQGISSCGCYQTEYNNSAKTERRTENHPYLHTRLYSIWLGMKKRCFNKNSRAYKWYGSKGIIVCDSWKNRFINFYEWSIKNGYSDDLTIDRIDSNGNYEPSNCRWIPWSDQNNNKTTSKILRYQGENISAIDLSRKYNICYTTLIGRLKRGWSVKSAIETKVDKRFKNSSYAT